MSGYLNLFAVYQLFCSRMYDFLAANKKSDEAGTLLDTELSRRMLDS